MSLDLAIISVSLGQMPNLPRPANFSPAMLAAINEASMRVFGNMPIVNHRTGFKILKRKPNGPIAANYYLPNMVPSFRKMDPTFRTELEENRIEKLIRLKRRGKGPPKKGHGKRTTRKK